MEIGAESNKIADEVPPTPEPYAEAERFKIRTVDETRAQRTAVENGNMTTFFDASGKKIKEVTVFTNTNQSQEIYYDENGAITHTIASDDQWKRDSDGVFRWVENQSD